MPTSPPHTADTSSDSSQGLNFIALPDYSPHQAVLENRVEALRADIKQCGCQIDPILVVRDPDGRHHIGEGEHRFAVMERLGSDLVLAQVFKFDETDKFRLAGWGHSIELPASSIIQRIRARSKHVPFEIAKVSKREAHRLTWNQRALVGVISAIESWVIKTPDRIDINAALGEIYSTYRDSYGGAFPVDSDVPTELDALRRGNTTILLHRRFAISELPNLGKKGPLANPKVIRIIANAGRITNVHCPIYLTRIRGSSGPVRDVFRAPDGSYGASDTLREAYLKDLINRGHETLTVWDVGHTESVRRLKRSNRFWNQCVH